jgi:glycosyltransferase involved in cell wall biosynthesis
MRIAILTTDERESIPGSRDLQPHIGIAPTALLQGFAGLPGVEVHVVSCLKEPLRSVPTIAPNIFFHGVFVPRSGWLRTLYQGCVRGLRRELRAIQPDIVHGQGTERYCAFGAALSRLPNVVTIHGNMKAIAGVYGARFGSYLWLTARLESFTLRRTGGVFCNSAYTERLVAPRTARTWRVDNALRMDFFRPLPAAVRSGPPVLLNVGVLEPRKQQLELLAMAGRLHAAGRRFQLQFAGPLAQADYGRAFERALAQAESAGYACYLGNLSAAQLVAAMDAAAALVHFPTEEAFGLVVAEALARNLKFFGSATGGMVDIAQGVDGAELIEPQNFGALQTAIAAWLDAGAPRPQQAAAVMAQRYHPKVIAARHLEIYREVLG